MALDDEEIARHPVEPRPAGMPEGVISTTLDAGAIAEAIKHLLDTSPADWQDTLTVPL